MPQTPRDPNQLAKLIVDIATGETEDTVRESKRNPSTRGRAGGLKEGKARAKRLSAANEKPSPKKQPRPAGVNPLPQSPVTSLAT